MASSDVASTGIRVGGRQARTEGSQPAWRAFPTAVAALIAVPAWCLASLMFADRANASDLGAGVGILRDGRSFTAVLNDVTAAGEYVFAEPSGPRTVAPRELVVWGAYSERSQAAQVILADGSVAVADVLSVEADAVVVAGRIWQETRLPRSAVQAILFHLPADPLARDQLLFRALESARRDQRLLLENGDELVGRLPEVIQPDAGARQMARIYWQSSGSAKPVEVPLDRVVGVLLAPGSAGPPAAGDADPLMVGLSDGSLLRVRAMRRTERTLEFDTVAGPRLVTEPFASPAGDPWDTVVMLQPLHAAVTYLSDLEPLGYRHIPFLDLPWPYQRDRSVDGGRLRCAGHVWSKGLGMHSSASLAYETGGKYRQLHAELAIDQRAGREGSVIFRVYTLGGEAAGGPGGASDSEQAEAQQWQVAYESPIVRGGQPATAIRVDLHRAQRIALIVDWADRADQWDHADWINARVVE